MDLSVFEKQNENPLLQHLDELFTECREVVEKKNLDYSNSEDPLANIKNSIVVGVDPKQGILVRLLDKISRISNLFNKNPDVVNESIDDSILDGINYLVLLSFYIKQEKNK